MNISTSQAYAGSTAHFDEVAQLNASGGDWDLEFSQLGTGKLGATVRRIETKSLGIVHLELQNAVLQTGSAPKGTRTFTVLGPGCPTYQWCGLEVSSSQHLSFDHRNGYESISPKGFSGFAVSISEDLLASALDKMQASDLVARLPAGGTLKSNDTSALRRHYANLFWYLNIFSQEEKTPGEHQQQFDSAEQALYDELALLIAQGEVDKHHCNPRQKFQTLKTAVGYITDNARDAITVADICGQAGVSPRTLERAFREQLGISPKACIKKVRLEGTRRDLQAASASNRVNDIAAQWGFWHMGDFARDYFCEYSELPSTTLALGN